MRRAGESGETIGCLVTPMQTRQNTWTSRSPNLCYNIKREGPESIEFNSIFLGRTIRFFF